MSPPNHLFGVPLASTIPKGPRPVRKLPTRSYEPGTGISWPIETDTIRCQIYPTEIPQSYYLKGFISPIRTTAETWTIHTAYKHSLEHYETCQEGYCPYQQKETTEPPGSQERTSPVTHQGLCRSRQPVEAQTGTLRDMSTSCIFQKAQQGHGSLPTANAPSALLHGNQPTKRQKTYTT